MGIMSCQGCNPPTSEKLQDNLLPGGKNRLLVDGKSDKEGGACARRTLHRDLAPMRLDNGLDDGQSQSGAAGMAGTIFMDPVEAFKNVGLIPQRDAWPVVGKSDVNLVLQSLGGDAQCRIFPGPIAQGIFNQVGKDLLHPPGISFRRSGILRPVQKDLRAMR